jgi:FtsP/CotA-like multicopper oxidase with cupredoxin domain
VDLGSPDRRQFLAAGGAAFFCTLAGHKVFFDQPADLPKLASSVPVPPRVAAADGPGATQFTSAGAAEAAKNAQRQYWIRAEKKEKWRIVPTHRDEMMDQRVNGRKSFDAYTYRAYTRDFGSPLDRGKMPGPLIEANVGETVAIHFQNALPVPVTMHPHGIFYANEMDGAYKGEYTDPGGFVQPGRTFTYIWDARPGTEGLWLYHDHGPVDPLPLFKGLFGPMIIRDPSKPRPDVEFFLFMHTLSPVATELDNQFSCINGHAYAGNTPTLRAKVGQRVAFHVIALDDLFHTFHLHGHRWTDPDGTVIDTKTMGPGESFTFEFVEDNPGRWFYHCHVFSHLHMGMNGWYLVS